MDRETSTFSNLVFLSGLAQSMQASDEHTIFVPNNNAFRDMSIENFNKLVNPDNRSNLVKFVQKHILPNKVMGYSFEENQAITRGVDDNIEISKSANNIYVGGAKIIQADIEASNGVLHIVNAVID